MEEKKWFFLCPRCGHSNKDAGYLADEESIYCLTCLNGENRRVRLTRWRYNNQQVSNEEIFRASLASVIRAAKDILFITAPGMTSSTKEEYWKQVSEHSRGLSIKQAIACMKVYQDIKWEDLNVQLEDCRNGG